MHITRPCPPCQAKGTDHAIITAHPHDLSGGRVQANIKKVASSHVYRVVVDADEEAQKLALTRGKMLGAAIEVGAAGLPAREFIPEKTSFPCDYCEWKIRCSVIEKDNFGMVLPPIPGAWRIHVDARASPRPKQVRRVRQMWVQVIDVLRPLARIRTRLQPSLSAFQDLRLDPSFCLAKRSTAFNTPAP